MKPTNTLSLQAAAAAVLLALGSSAALAQQDAQDPSLQQPPEQQQSPLSQAGEQETSERSTQEQQPSESAGQEAEAGQDETQIARAGDTGQSSADLDQLAEENQDISRFIEAIKAAGMEESLTQGTSYTVFAPTDEALEEVDLEQLMQPENNDQLVSLLRAHIVADDVDAQMARSLGRAQTIDGGTIEISESDGELMIGDASVVEPDIQQGSLRVHTIDQVLSEGRTQTAAAEGQSQGAQPQESERESGLESELEQEAEQGQQELEEETDSLLR
ncbi:MAG: fasciclin domain-containing protein [Gammaproteobacteria bacterium]|nr:fasciclin domain-containing protein [Gammaproteobacteria bacterium]